VALFYSRFHRKKRVLELIDAWLEDGPRHWLLLMAGIPQEYSAEMLNEYVLRKSDTTPWLPLNDHGGWCVPWEEFPPALRAAVAEGPDRLRARGAQAQAWVTREYSWEKPARLLAEFYAELRRA
jgi:glycosyltransferase involved in cell wall biosynthesis